MTPSNPSALLRPALVDLVLVHRATNMLDYAHALMFWPYVNRPRWDGEMLAAVIWRITECLGVVRQLRPAHLAFVRARNRLAPGQPYCLGEVYAPSAHAAVW